MLNPKTANKDHNTANTGEKVLGISEDELFLRMGKASNPASKDGVKSCLRLMSDK